MRGPVPERRLVVTVERPEDRHGLIGCLRACGAQPEPLTDCDVAVELDQPGCPGLATLVAEIEAWRCSGRGGTVVLALGGERRVLRTEA